MNSRLPGLYRDDVSTRRQRLDEASSVGLGEADLLDAGGLSTLEADRLIENVVGVFGMPLGIATNLQVNGRDVLVPMVVEEASVVAGMSNGARLARTGGGFQTEADPPLMMGQIQVLDVADSASAISAILAHRAEILATADLPHPTITALGGGARDVQAEAVATSAGDMLIVTVRMDVRDAMGANAINTSMEAVGPLIELLTGGRVGVRVLSNLADERLARAACRVPLAALETSNSSGDQVAKRIVEAAVFAAADTHRAATHNKGIMNGIDAVAVATGNDWRAVEAGAHAYAARSGRYMPLSDWTIEGAALVGTLEMPLAVGIVGGMTRAHPLATWCLRLIGAASAGELAQVLAAVGLAQNLAALRALVTEGIQPGHMRLHQRHAIKGASC